MLRTIAPNLLEQFGVGPTVAAQLLITAGDSPERIRNERAFAMLCGAAPIPASSGRTDRHRLNRGGDRRANTALHTVALCRWAKDPRTRDYVQRRRGQGLGTAEIMRCLKRYLARELYAHIQTALAVRSLPNRPPDQC